ncbi:chemotaxis protein CheW [Desulfosarcina sp. OttesenSCG-928-G10]|nr:chemotaxis protein CheW [Desulfosarcina sp. OttesenSCG-928-G10]
MADAFHKPKTEEAEHSLQAMLAVIDRENAQELAQDTALFIESVAQRTRKKEPCIAFLLGDDEMALPVAFVQEIGYLPEVTPLPNIPSWIRGIVQIRGEILSVVDCSLLFGIKAASHGQPQKPSYVLFRRRELKFCLMVDRIAGVVNLDEQHEPLLPFSLKQSAHLSGLAPFFRGIHTVDNRMVHILDGEKLGASSLILKWQ